MSCLDMDNNNKEFAFFLPTRKGSERVVNKNTKEFAGIEGGLLKLKLEQLLRVSNIPIYLSTNDEESIRIAESFNNNRLFIVERPDELCLSTTLLSDLINYVPKIIHEEHIIWVHTTEPFVNEDCYNKIIKTYSEEVVFGQRFDSLMTCSKIQNFLWSKEENTFLSHDRKKIGWPRTQDIKPIYEINSAVFINSKSNYLAFGDRIGRQPYLYELSKLESIDIDWEEDFILAEILYESINKKV